MSDRAEARFLLAVLNERFDEAETLAKRHPPDPETLVALAIECDVHPMVHARLRAAGRLDLVGSEAAERLDRLRAKCRNDNLLLLARLEQALDLLLEAGIVPVVLKGTDYLHRFYASFDERTLDDVDLLVSPREAGRAIEALREAGWSLPSEPEQTHWLRSSFEMPMESPGPVTVAFEVHWGLAQDRRYRVDIEPVLARTETLEISGRTVRRLEDHDAAAHLLLHHLQHYFDRRLKWALDLVRIASGPEFRWDEVARRVETWGGRAAAGLSLLHLRKTVPAAAPREALRAVPVSLWRRLVTLPLRTTHPLDLFRETRRRSVQLWLAAAALERPSELPAYLRHRATRDRSEDAGPGRPA